MIVGIVGLGLIGGSFAKAFSKAGHTVYACDIDASVVHFAMLEGTVNRELTAETLRECDLLLLCVYVEDAIQYLEANQSRISPDTLVLDSCGTKRRIMEYAPEIARRNGFLFVGGHPMAGKQYSGYKYASEDLFRGAPMILVPPSPDDIRLLSRAREALSPAGFAKYSATTAEEHDRIIAYTSQLAHIVSSAYVKRPGSAECKPFSAGSFRDMTRVAEMNGDMWTDLFMENRDNLITEIEELTLHLNEYRDALVAADAETVRALILEGTMRKRGG